MGLIQYYRINQLTAWRLYFHYYANCILQSCYNKMYYILNDCKRLHEHSNLFTSSVYVCMFDMFDVNFDIILKFAIFTGAAAVHP